MIGSMPPIRRLLQFVGIIRGPPHCATGGFVEVVLVRPVWKIDSGEIHPQLSVLAADRPIGVLEDRRGHDGMNVAPEL